MESKKHQKTPNECVQVVVRCRPVSSKEIAYDGGSEVVAVYPSRGVVEIQSPLEKNKENKKMFTYDAVYDKGSSQIALYDETVRPLVASVLEGFNCCVFAYGQTGTGKTFTMEGDRRDFENKGIIPRSFEQIWTHINRAQNMNFLVAVSYLEIYMEELFDLLKPTSKNLELREKEKVGVYVPNLHSVLCKSVDEMISIMKLGNKNRTVGFTNMNEHSSRSHAIFMIKIEMCEVGSKSVKVGKLNLVDLAGSERQTKSGARAERLKEASKINLALSSLGNVISALAENAPHIPYRDSKLTRLLQDSLGGNSKTIMIANIGPSSFNYNETLTTLRYATRAKTIQNKPVKNEDPQDAKLKEYQEEIARLRQQIAERQKKENISQLKKLKGLKREKMFGSGELNYAVEIESENDGKPIDLESLAAIEREREITAQLAEKLQKMEGQLVKGGINILDTYTERQMELEKKLIEISERKKREVEMQQQLELQEETALTVAETVTSLQQEVELKTRKLSKCYAKYLALQQELNDTKFEHNRDLRELEMIQNELIKELKRLLLIIENFVPIEVKNRLYTQAKYDDEQEEWKMCTFGVNDSSCSKRLVANTMRRRPFSEFALQEAKKENTSTFRYKSENIISYELDMPCRTTHEYNRPRVSANLQAALEEAMETQGEADIEFADTTSAGLQANKDVYQKMNVTSFNLRDTKSSNIHSTRPSVTGKKPVSAYAKSRGFLN